MPDHYEVLQVSPRAERDVIQAAFRALARRHHPDFGGDPRRMAALNEAWRVLGDPGRRAAYDAARSGRLVRPAARVTSAPPVTRPAGPIAAAAERAAAGRPVGSRPVMGHDGRADPGDERTPRAPGTLDFGRYEGWPIEALAEHDPDYLLWLARTPIGRPLRADIDTVLAARAERFGRGATATAVRPRPSRFRLGGR